MALAWLQGHRGLVLGMGCGVLIGMSGTLVIQNTYNQVDTRLAHLCMQLDYLKSEIESLKAQLGHKQVSSVQRGERTVRMGYYSVHPSSGEDDDDQFEDASSNQPADLARGSKALPAAVTGDLDFGNAEQVFERVDLLLEGTDPEKEQAWGILNAAYNQLSDNSDYMWRLAKSTYFMSQIEGMRGNTDQQKTLVYKSLDHATKGLNLNGENPYTHKWYAITLGSVGDYESNSIRIQNGYKFKEHIDMAIKLKPEDPSTHYLKGRWCFGVYMLTWVERRIAATLFGEPPSSTVDEALDEFMEADRLDPGKWKENLLYIGKCYVEKKDYYKAMQFLTQANNLPTVSADEKEAQKEVDQLMYKYSGYKS